MRFDSFWAYPQGTGNLPHFVAFADELEDFEFAIGQKTHRIVGRVDWLIGPVMLELRCDRPVSRCNPSLRP